MAQNRVKTARFLADWRKFADLTPDTQNANKGTERDAAISKVSLWFNAGPRPPISHLLAEFAALKHGMVGSRTVMKSGRAVTELRSSLARLKA